MKVDLHCHTRKVKQGDPDGREVTPKVFVEKVMDANLQIVAITNHNLFDIKQYEEIRRCLDDSIQLWPGIELDIRSSKNSRWHLLVIANPQNYREFSRSVDDLLKGKSKNNVVLEFQDVHSKLYKHDVIYVPHLHKHPSISDEEMEEIESIVENVHRVFYEPSDLRSLGVFANHGYRMLIGSDNREWANYEKFDFPELRLPVSSFPQFCLFAERDINLIDTILSSSGFTDVEGKPHHSVSLKLRLYNEVNIFFGQKGTGKSEILKSINKELMGMGKSCQYYIGNEKEDDFKKLLSIKDIDRDVTVLDVKSCADEIEYINSWKEVPPTPFQDYYNWLDTSHKNKNKRLLRITNSTALAEQDTKKLNVSKSDYKVIIKIIQLLDQINLIQYVNEAFSSELNALLLQLKEKIRKALIALLIDKNATDLTNFSIDKIKNLADGKTSTVSRPSTTGFRGFALNRLRLKETALKILSNITNKETMKTEYLGELEDKGSLSIATKYRMLCDQSKAEEYDRGTITKLRDVLTKLKSISENYQKADITSVVAEFKEDCESLNLKEISKFIGLSRSVIDNHGNIYTPSSGEKGILLLQQKLGESADAYILDEPDLGMGNSYIDSTIRPKISQLGKAGKIVLVATHNANIAVRTLPYRSYYRQHKNGVYKTYSGNPFVDTLTNIEDENDTLSWTDISMKVLEGSEEAFYERKRIYESGSNTGTTS